MGLLLAATGVGAAGGGASAATPGQTITVKVPAGSAGGHASYEVPVTGDQHRQRVEGVSTITIHNPAQMDATITECPARWARRTTWSLTCPPCPTP